MNRFFATTTAFAALLAAGATTGCGDRVVTLASGVGHFTVLAEDDRSVCYASQGLQPDGQSYAIGCAPKPGGGASRLLARRAARQVVVDSLGVYWINGRSGAGNLMRTPTTGGEAVLLVDATGGSGAAGDPVELLALDSTHVYWRVGIMGTWRPPRRLAPEPLLGRLAPRAGERGGRRNASGRAVAADVPGASGRRGSRCSWRS